MQAPESSLASMLDWSEQDVADFLHASGFPDLTAAIHEHGISDEVLAMMESDDLKEVGVSSVGMRLGILKAVEALKLEQGLADGAGEAVVHGAAEAFGLSSNGDPPVTSTRLTASTSSPAIVQASPTGVKPLGSVHGHDLNTILRLIDQQTERINHLEEVIMLLTAGSVTFPSFSSATFTPRTAGAAVSQVPSSEPVNFDAPPHEHSSTATSGLRTGWLKKQPSFKWATYGRKASKGSPVPLPSAELDDGESEDAESKQPTAVTPIAGQQRLPTPNVESISPKTPTNATTLPIPHPATATSTLANRPGLPVSPGMNAEAVPTTASTYSLAPRSTPSRPSASDDSSALPAAPNPLPVIAPLNTSKSSATPSEAQRSSSTSALGSAQNPQKFKVTLDDPCWKVLPAALKKYKIQDDWRMYALFICYGSTGPGTGTERCLSYDEKPLLLFQKLKETNQSPVFMLRHIRDIQSPITLAQTKRSAKAATQPQTSRALTPPPAVAASAASSSLSNPHPSARQSMLPAKTVNGSATPGPAAGATSALPRSESGARLEDKMTYAVAIYPYDPEREDEFSVGVDDTFLVLSKAKGWWIVQRDPGGTGGTTPDSALAGWVPAGCLLELTRPPASAGGSFGQPPGREGGTQQQKGRLRLADIKSTSYPGVALMSYRKAGGDEMDLDKDDVMWVFKRYSHWSYAIKEATGERGWVPSWFIGSQPPSAAEGEGVSQTPKIVGSPTGEAGDTTAAAGDQHREGAF